MLNNKNNSHYNKAEIICIKLKQSISFQLNSIIDLKRFEQGHQVDALVK